MKEGVDIRVQRRVWKRSAGITLRSRDNPQLVDSFVEKLLGFCARRPALCTENCRFPGFFCLLALTIRATLFLHARVLGGRKRRESLADFVQKADARRGSPEAVTGSRRRVCSSSRSDGLARQRLPPAGGRCRFGRHQVPLRITAFRPGHPPSLRGTDAPTGRRGPSGSRARRNPRGSSGLSPGFGRSVRCRSGLAPYDVRPVRGEPAAAARLVLKAAVRGRRRKRRASRYRPPRWGCGSFGDQRPHRCRCRGRQVRLPARVGR